MFKCWRLVSASTFIQLGSQKGPDIYLLKIKSFIQTRYILCNHTILHLTSMFLPCNALMFVFYCLVSEKCLLNSHLSSFCRDKVFIFLSYLVPERRCSWMGLQCNGGCGHRHLCMLCSLPIINEWLCWRICSMIT